MTFRQKLASQKGCDEDAVVSRAVIACVTPWKRPLYRMASMLAPSGFEHDRDVVADALNARSIAEVKHSVDMLHYRARRRAVFWRDAFGLRVSGRRLMRLATKAFHDPAL